MNYLRIWSSFGWKLYMYWSLNYKWSIAIWKKNNIRLYVWNLLLIPRKAGFIIILLICMLGSFVFIDNKQRPPHVAISPLNKRKTYDNITCNICKTSPIASLLLNVAIFLIPKTVVLKNWKVFLFYDSLAANVLKQLWPYVNLNELQEKLKSNELFIAQASRIYFNFLSKSPKRNPRTSTRIKLSM